MNVAQLIQQLQKFDPTMEVGVGTARAMAVANIQKWTQRVDGEERSAVVVTWSARAVFPGAEVGFKRIES